MLAIFLKTLPFFAIIALGYAAGRMRFFSAEATGYLTKFVPVTPPMRCVGLSTTPRVTAAIKTALS